MAAGALPLERALALAGAAGLAVVAVILLGGALMVWKLRRAWKGLASAVGGLGHLGLMTQIHRPATITPRRVARQAWKGVGEAAVAHLEGAGFAHGGTFKADELGELVVDTWLRADGAQVALSAMGEAAPFWIDVHTGFADGTTLTVTNAPKVDAVRIPPWKERAVLPGVAGLPDLLQEFDRRLAGRIPVPPPADLGAHLAAQYTREIEWRALTAPDEAELRRLAAAHQPDQPLGEDTLRLLVEQERQWAVSTLQALLRPRLVEASGLSATAWERVGDDSHVVLDRQGGEEVAGNLPGPEDDEAGATGGPAPADPFSCLAWHNARMPQDRRLRLAARLDAPLRAELWVPDGR